MPFSPINLGNIIQQGEAIQGSRLQNLRLSQAMDPNSPTNQLMQLQIESRRLENEALRNPVIDTQFNGIDTPTSQMKNDRYRAYLISQGATEDDIKRFDASVARPWYGDIGKVPSMVLNAGAPQPMQGASLEGEMQGAGSIKNAEVQGTLAGERGLPYTAPVGLNEIDLGVQTQGAPQPIPTEASNAAAVTTANAMAQESVKQKVTDAKNKKAFATYQTTSANVMRSMNKTMTGYFMGKIPAMTVSSQVAEHANNVLFPAIKKLVREGESGVFTDQDAMDVRRLMPTRETKPEALPMIMWQLDSWVASKLGQAQPPMPAGFEDQSQESEGKTINWSDM